LAFSPEFLDEIRARVPLSSVVGRRVNLVKKGREWQGLCPFHNEKTPSFYVNDDKGFYHCFGCSAHGDVIRFVTETENLSFPEVVEQLAGEAGLEVPKRNAGDREREDRRKVLFALMEEACAWFQKQLQRPEGGDGLAYLKNRGLSDRMLQRFRLGFAPDSRDALKTALTARGHHEDALIELGLLRKPDNGRPAYDYFRGRVIFPIMDRRGRPIAFGGRTLGDGQPKYLNSPETILFHKGRTLFGLDAAREAARTTERIIVAEGYMDVIALHQAGFAESVAPLGTALTEEQIVELWRVVPRAVLCFDGDSAGRRAAYRAAERAVPLIAPGKTIRFARLPEGQDPDDLVKGKGPGAFQQVLETAAPLDAVLWQMTVEGQPSGTPEDLAALKNRLRDAVARIGDKDVAREYRNAFDRRAIAAFDEPLFETGTNSGRTGAPTGPGRRARNPASAFVDGYRGGFDAGRNRQWRMVTTVARQVDRLTGRDRRAFEAGYDAGFRDGQVGRYRASDRQHEWQATVRNRPTPGQMPSLERLLLLLAINHPKLAIENEEAFGRLKMPAGPLTDLHRAIVSALDGEAVVDSSGLKRHLNDSDFGPVLESLTAGSVYVHAAFARPDATVEQARDGWRDIMTSMERRDAVAEATAELAEADLETGEWTRQADRLAAALHDRHGTAGDSNDPGANGGRKQ